MIKNRFIALISRCVCFIICFFGIIDTMGAFGGRFSGASLMFYTVQSNILVLLMFGLLIFKTSVTLKNEGADGSAGFFPRLSMICSIDILLTFGVYWIMLVPQQFAMTDGGMNLWSFSNLAVHGITPLLMLADYIFFTESGHLKVKDIFLCAVYPLFYVVLSTIAGFSGYVYFNSDNGPVRFPYFFIDYDQQGGLVAVYIIALLAVFFLLGFLLYLLDKKVKKPVLFPRALK